MELGLRMMWERHVLLGFVIKLSVSSRVLFRIWRRMLFCVCENTVCLLWVSFKVEPI